jgi:hypothetical protein
MTMYRVRMVFIIEAFLNGNLVLAINLIAIPLMKCDIYALIDYSKYKRIKGAEIIHDQSL